MTYRVVVTPAAEANLDDIFGYIARDKPSAARKHIAILTLQLKGLAQFPKRCPFAPENGLGGMEIRHLIHGDYRIVFAIDGKTVLVLQIRHGARLPIGDPK